MDRTELRRRLTVGAELQTGRRRRRARLGAGLSRGWNWSFPPTTAAPQRAIADGRATRTDTSGVRRRGARRAGATGSARRRTACVPTRRRAGSPTARIEPSAYVDPARSRGPTRRARDCQADRPGRLRDARRHLHRGRHVARRGRASSTELARIGITVDRDDADRGVPGTLRLGLRRRQSLRSGAHLRHAGRPARLRRSRARLRPRRHSRRRLQPSRARRQLPDRVLARLLHRQVHQRLGRAINFEGPRPARALFVQNARYWIEEFHFDGLRLDATQDIKDASPRTSSPTLSRRRARRPGDMPIYVVAENEPQDTRLVAVRAAAAATASTRCGTTMRTMRRWWR